MSQPTYVEQINSVLRPKPATGPLVLDLFAGCGGLSLGFESQGFEVTGYEADSDCCSTYNKNLLGRCEQVFLTEETLFPSARVIVAGPPCQPFSVIGNQRGKADSRNGFPAFVSAVRRIQPDIWLFENVRGLFYKSKHYMDQVISELTDLGYVVDVRLLNAVDFGVPQNRERVIAVGHRGNYKFPSKLSKKVNAGEAIGDTAALAPLASRFLTESQDKYIAEYERKSCCIRPRDLYLELPARTLTCRNLGGATSDMQRVKLPDGRRRRLLLEEATRLQSFPDWFKFEGNEGSKFNQVGNAVAPLFSWHLAKSVRDYLESDFRLDLNEIREKSGLVQPALL